MFESECTPDRNRLSRVAGPQETVGVSAQRYDHYGVDQAIVGRDLIGKRTPGVDEEQILDFIHVSGHIQLVTKSIQKGNLDPHKVDELPFKPVFLQLTE